MKSEWDPIWAWHCRKNMMNNKTKNNVQVYHYYTHTCIDSYEMFVCVCKCDKIY